MAWEALIMPAPPAEDQYGRRDTTLADALGISNAAKVQMKGAYARIPGFGRVYDILDAFTAVIPDHAEPLSFNAETETVTGARWPVGRGEALWLGFTFHYGHFAQAAMMEYLTGLLGAKPAAESSNRNVWTAYWTDGIHKLLYVMNLFASPQKTEIVLHDEGRIVNLGEINLAAMEVKTIEKEIR